MNSSALLNSLRVLMDDYGEAVYLSKVTSGTYNVATGQMTGGSATNHEVRGFFFNNHPSEAPMTTIGSGRKRLALYAKTIDGTDLPAPDVEDKIIANLNGHGAGPGPGGGDGLISGNIVEVQVIRAEGVPMVYLLRVET